MSMIIDYTVYSTTRSNNVSSLSTETLIYRENITNLNFGNTPFVSVSIITRK